MHSASPNSGRFGNLTAHISESRQIVVLVAQLLADMIKLLAKLESRSSTAVPAADRDIGLTIPVTPVAEIDSLPLARTTSMWF